MDIKLSLPLYRLKQGGVKMSKKVYISREEVWNKVKDCMRRLGTEQVVNVYYRVETDTIWKAITWEDDYLDYDREKDIFIDTLVSIDKFWTDFPLRLEDIVQDAEELKRVKENMKELEDLLLSCYEATYLEGKDYEVDI
jgi:hypothetical protein